MVEIAARPFLAAGVLHLVAAAVLGVVAAAPSALFPEEAHVLVAMSGLVLLAAGLTHGYASPFLKKEPRSPLVAHASFASFVAADALLLAGSWVPLDYARMAVGVGCILLAAHVLLVALVGTSWRGGVALFAKEQPFRDGDRVAAAAFALAFVGLLETGIHAVEPPRGLPTSMLTAFLLLFAFPFFGGFLLFLLPRNVKRPAPGLTLHAAALVLFAASAVGFVLAFVFPVGARFLYPAVGAALAVGFAFTAFLRLGAPASPGAQFLRARGALRGAAAMAVLAPVVLLLATVTTPPSIDLLRLALEAHLVLAALLALAAVLLGAPVLVNAVPREGRWASWAAALAIVGLFLLAPAFQHPRAAFPGALVLLAATLVMLAGLWPMRVPRRDCPP